MKSKHIFIIEDEKNLLKSIKFILLANDYDVSTAFNGKEGLDDIINHVNSGKKIDLIITDIVMPGMNGLDVIRELRNNGIDIPTIVITAHSNIDNVKEIFQSGCFLIIDKPFDKKILLDSINDFFESDNTEVPHNIMCF